MVRARGNLYLAKAIIHYKQKRRRCGKLMDGKNLIAPRDLYKISILRTNILALTNSHALTSLVTQGQQNYIPVMQRSLEFHVSRGTLCAEIKRQNIYIETEHYNIPRDIFKRFIFAISVSTLIIYGKIFLIALLWFQSILGKLVISLINTYKER